jgi:type III secretion system FlhB-like substrate exporter
MEKEKLASAIGYEPGSPAPELLASGRGYRAQDIVAIAQKSGIRVVEDPVLASLLDAAVEPGDYIPPWCWEAVAGILAFVTKQRV